MPNDYPKARRKPGRPRKLKLKPAKVKMLYIRDFPPYGGSNPSIPIAVRRPIY